MFLNWLKGNQKENHHVGVHPPPPPISRGFGILITGKKEEMIMNHGFPHASPFVWMDDVGCSCHRLDKLGSWKQPQGEGFFGLASFSDSISEFLDFKLFDC